MSSSSAQALPCQSDLLLGPLGLLPSPATPLLCHSISSPSSLTFSCYRAFVSALPAPSLSSSLPKPVFAQCHYSSLNSRIIYSGKAPDHLGGLVTKSCLTLATPRTVAHQDPLSMGFSRQEYWSGLPFPSPGSGKALPNQNIGSCYTVIHLHFPN